MIYSHPARLSLSFPKAYPNFRLLLFGILKLSGSPHCTAGATNQECCNDSGRECDDFGSGQIWSVLRLSSLSSVTYTMNPSMYVAIETSYIPFPNPSLWQGSSRQYMFCQRPRIPQNTLEYPSLFLPRFSSMNYSERLLGCDITWM
jgi:hypothetical protein